MNTADANNKTLDDLIRRAQSGGDPAAFDPIVARFQDFAVGYARTLLGGDSHAAEDAAQEAFLQAFRDLPTLREPAAFPGWLRQIVRKHCDRMTRRKQVPTAGWEAAGEIAGSRALDPALVLEAAERRVQVRQAVAALPPGERAAITLFYLGGHTVATVATFLQVPAPTVRKRLQRARLRLKERMLTMIENTLRDNAPSKSARFTEVSNLLRRITSLLENDARVVAAYLARFGDNGGWGPHDEDVWGSINVHVVVADERLDDFATERRAFAARLGQPLLHVEGPQNAPPFGYYLMALYDGEAGPYEVDWYWHRRSTTRLPSDTHLLFDRTGLPAAGEPIVWGYTNDVPPALQQIQNAMTNAEKQAEEQRNVVSLFWAMLLIGAKGVARDPHSEYDGFLQNLGRFLAKTRAFLPDATPPSNPPPLSPQEKLDQLRAMAVEMETLTPRVAATGADVPTAIAPRARQFLDLVEAEVREA